MYDPVFPDPLPTPLEPDAAAAPPAAAAAAAPASAVPPSIIPASFVGGRASKASTHSFLSTQTPSKPTSARTCRNVFIGSLRNIARAAACSCVSVSRGTFDGFLGLPRRLRGASSASILAPAAPAPAAASSALDNFLGRPPLLTGADVSPVHLQSTRTR